MKLIIVRHGETEENKQRIWQGHSEGTLSKEGREQAKKLVNRLEKEAINMIYCSDLKRTKNTIKPFLENNNITIEYVKALRERNLGLLERSTTEQITEHEAKNKTDFENCNFETGETFYEMRDRIIKFWGDVVKKHENHTVLFVTHGGTVSQIMLFLFDYSTDEFREFIPDNASITEIEVKEGKPELLTFNDISHL